MIQPHPVLSGKVLARDRKTLNLRAVLHRPMVAKINCIPEARVNYVVKCGINLLLSLRFCQLSTKVPSTLGKALNGGKWAKQLKLFRLKMQTYRFGAAVKGQKIDIDIEVDVIQRSSDALFKTWFVLKHWLKQRLQ